jgi:2'-5' RNA ligase
MVIPIYTGIFLNNDELYALFPPQLSVRPAHLHVTLIFRGGIESAHEELLGETVTVRIVGYGNNSKNEGLKVELEASNPELQKLCDAVKVPHITLSASREAQMKDTKLLDFEPLENPIEITGRYGVVTHTGLTLV